MDKAYIDLLNARNLMSDKERRQSIINETFTPVFNAFFGVAEKDKEPAHGGDAAAHTKGNEDA